MSVMASIWCVFFVFRAVHKSKNTFKLDGFCCCWLFTRRRRENIQSRSWTIKRHTKRQTENLLNGWSSGFFGDCCVINVHIHAVAYNREGIGKAYWPTDEQNRQTFKTERQTNKNTNIDSYIQTERLTDKPTKYMRADSQTDKEKD